MQHISVLMDNRPGIVADITELMASHQINILTLNVDGIEDHGVMRLSVDQYDQALQVLRQAQYRAISEDALVVRIRDEPGALAKIASRFKTHQLNIRSIHILDRQEGYVLVSIVSDDNHKASTLVADNLVP